MSPAYKTGAVTDLATDQLATAESNRAIPPYQSGPFTRLSRGHRRRVEVPSPTGQLRHWFSGPVAAPAAYSPRKAGDSDATAYPRFA